MFSGLIAMVLSIYFSSVVHALSCEKGFNGEDIFFDGGNRLSNEEFDCMRGSHEVKSRLLVIPPASTEPPLFCKAVINTLPFTKNVFEKVEVPTGIRCKYECKDHINDYRCLSKPFQNHCPCESKKLSVIVKPVSSELGASSILGQSEETEREGEQTCKGKEEGFQWADTISCVGIRASVFKKRVHFKKDKTDECFFETSEKPETRYTETAPDNLNLQGCMYVCKKASPRCTKNLAGRNCECMSPGLVRQLVPLSELSLNARVRQTACSEGQCGSCGMCVEGECKLKPDAHLGNHCPCGEICPMVDNRRENLGGQLLCEPNFRLSCMAKPEWKGSDGGVYRPGTKFPDYCTPGETADQGDSCGCAPGYVEKPGDPELANFVCIAVTPEPVPNA